MSNQNVAEQQRLAEILKLARMQLNEEYMKQHSIAHTAWITSARTAWNTTGTLLPFTTKFVYPTEEEVIARGVEIYNRLTQAAPAPVVSPATIPVITTDPVDVVEAVQTEPTTELLQAGGDFVIAEVSTEDVAVEEPNNEVTDVVAKEDVPLVDTEPTVADSLLENKFKSLFTKWGGKGSY